MAAAWQCYHGRMPRNPAPEPDNPEQHKRCVETAREVGADQQGEAFERVLDKVARSKPDKAEHHPAKAPHSK